MKKVLALLLAAVMVFSLAACNNGGNTPKPAEQSEVEKIVADARTEADREKSEIIASAQKEISDMVTGAVEKLALEQSASDAFDQFLDAAEEADHE